MQSKTNHDEYFGKKILVILYFICTVYKFINTSIIYKKTVYIEQVVNIINKS